MKIAIRPEAVRVTMREGESGCFTQNILCNDSAHTFKGVMTFFLEEPTMLQIAMLPESKERTKESVS